MKDIPRRPIKRPRKYEVVTTVSWTQSVTATSREEAKIQVAGTFVQEYGFRPEYSEMRAKEVKP